MEHVAIFNLNIKLSKNMLFVVMFVLHFLHMWAGNVF